MAVVVVVVVVVIATYVYVCVRARVWLVGMSSFFIIYVAYSAV